MSNLHYTTLSKVTVGAKTEITCEVDIRSVKGILTLDEFYFKAKEGSVLLDISSWDYLRYRQYQSFCFKALVLSNEMLIPVFEEKKDLEEEYLKCLREEIFSGKESIATLLIHTNNYVRTAAKKIFEEKMEKSID